MAWDKSGSTTLTSTENTIDVSGFTASKFNVFLNHALGSTGGIGSTITLDDVDTAGLYTLRYNENGTEATRTSNQEAWLLRFNGYDQFDVGYISNIINEDKLFIGWCVAQQAAGADEAPNYAQFAGVFDNNAQFTQITNVNDGGTAFNISSNLTALGSDGVSSVRVQDGAIFYETDTNKSYVLSSDTWTEL